MTFRGVHDCSRSPPSTQAKRVAVKGKIIVSKPTRTAMRLQSDGSIEGWTIELFM